MSTAGQMTTTPGGNPQWRTADGSVIYGYQAPIPPQTARPHTVAPYLKSYGTYRDWVIQQGFNRTSGIGGWRITLPRSTGTTYYVTTADDSGDNPLNMNWDANHPPAGVK